MAVKIDKKIKGYSVITPDDKARETAAAAKAALTVAPVESPADNIVHMHERIERPEMLIGSTYKIKSPLVEHAFYVTINDIVLNQDTEHELRRPFEIFINSKSMEHFQWIVALTRIMSAVFRKGGDVTFIVDEMKAVFDPKGGYFKAGGVYMPSLVAELGSIVEDHMKSIGLLHDPEMSVHQRALIAEKRKQFEERSKKNSEVTATPTKSQSAALAQSQSAALAPSLSQSEGEGRGGVAFDSASEADTEIADNGSFPPGATMCHKCNTKALVLMDGCQTCLNCGYSKCG
ncbi:ribonucleotide-diphosphate reductase subunit alpha [compost metagenome]